MGNGPDELWLLLILLGLDGEDGGVEDGSDDVVELSLGGQLAGSQCGDGPAEEGEGELLRTHVVVGIRNGQQH